MTEGMVAQYAISDLVLLTANDPSYALTNSVNQLRALFSPVTCLTTRAWHDDLMNCLIIEVALS